MFQNLAQLLSRNTYGGVLPLSWFSRSSLEMCLKFLVKEKGAVGCDDNRTQQQGANSHVRQGGLAIKQNKMKHKFEENCVVG